MKIERTPRGDYIQGRFVKVLDPNGEIFSHNPGDLNQPKLSFPYCYQHVQEAVSAAKRAFVSWRRQKLADRLACLSKYQKVLTQRCEEVAQLISFEVGKPLWESRQEILETSQMIEFFVREAQNQVKHTLTAATGGMDTQQSARVLPRGAFVVVSPAATPVLGPNLHVVPALVFGNTIILKSPKFAPSIGQALAEIAHDAGFPAGVFNVIQGNSEISHRLASHSEIDGVFYTGSYETGLKIRKQLLGDHGKIQVFDTGGKNAMVAWEDCDYPKTLKAALLSAFLSTGQRCHSVGRILVHQKIFDKFVQDFHQLSKQCRVGYGLSEGADTPLLGPLVREGSQENYLRYQGIAVREGCEEIMRGKTLERDRKGYYVSPSIHRVQSPDPKSVYQTGEIFGPNVALFKVSDLDETAEIINQTKYGLAAAVYTGNRENFVRLADEVRVGLFHWNRMTVEPTYSLPTGGLKQSGNNRWMGSFSIHQCTYLMSSLERAETETALLTQAPLPKL